MSGLAQTGCLPAMEAGFSVAKNIAGAGKSAGAGPSTSSMGPGMGGTRLLPPTFGGPPPTGRKKTRILPASLTASAATADPGSSAAPKGRPATPEDAEHMLNVALETTPSKNTLESQHVPPLASHRPDKQQGARNPAGLHQPERENKAAALAFEPTGAVQSRLAHSLLPRESKPAAKRNQVAGQQKLHSSTSSLAGNNASDAGPSEAGLASTAIRALAEWKGLSLEDMARNLLGLSQAARDALRQAYAGAHANS